MRAPVPASAAPHVLPDYAGGGLLNLVASLAAARGAQVLHPTLASLPPQDIAEARNVVFLLVDGLGLGALTRAGPDLALARHLHGAITSVFPSTTAAAITTSFTGLAPVEHGLTGWHIHLAEAGGVVAPLPFHTRGDHRPLGAIGVTTAAILPPHPLLDGLATPAWVVTPHQIVDSEYSRHAGGTACRRGCAGLAGLVNEVEAIVHASVARKFVYAYHPDYDSTAHRFGAGSREAHAHLLQVDAAFAALCERLAGTDTVIVASADHGFVDSTPGQRLELEDFPMLAELLRLPLCGEPRVAFCHVQPGQEAEFAGRAATMLRGVADVHCSRELVAAGWFGAGTPHPRLAERVGDVALVMRPGYVLRDWAPGEKRYSLVGNHGGTTPDEMMIPLVVARV